ncbi:Nmad3 family putative nucleotide modification protein [Halostagnicola kamekurae]|uniref:Nucleotide modification associated domain-containing protein n=1 Tax=Halostagnicola kamekurae TaxID=619731 RepID=A0A1I6QI80_9EURY|nr:hypothetical protein [Halostagnicola kamekurae]SFS52102.1 hypothetical protein SAMN04488556_1287 [Halostagnicola kamekurae]
MTVVLAGVGADTTNLGALGALTEDGRFDYVPIPEKTRHTSESETLGSWPLRTRDGVAADLASTISPRPIADEETRLSGADLAEWPLHRDPNFDALTYGEHRNGYVSRLRALEPGDVVGFYAGLRRPDGDRAHRYLLGYFTVDAVDVLEPDASADRRRAVLEAHSENAHAKRARDGLAYHPDKTIALVNGREPGGLFDRQPIRLSEYYVKSGNERAQYYLRETVADAFSVTAGGENMMYKPAYRCSISGESFRELVGVPGERSSEHGHIADLG